MLLICATKLKPSHRQQKGGRIRETLEPVVSVPKSSILAAVSTGWILCEVMDQLPDGRWCETTRKRLYFLKVSHAVLGISIGTIGIPFVRAVFFTSFETGVSSKTATRKRFTLHDCARQVHFSELSAK
eukprot:EG_transcript_25202